jgi:pimeloyl-ACP methyl ester carboxylesterase
MTVPMVNLAGQADPARGRKAKCPPARKMTTPVLESLYLHCEPDPAFATLHGANPAELRDTAVILCPPFGWEEVCSYRPLRHWAQALAQAGYPALRLSLPATGDSGGDPTEPDRVSAWRDSIHYASRWTREALGVRRVAVLGIGLGGLLAAAAEAQEPGFDDLVLWGVPSGGKELVRQLRAFSRLERSRFFEDLPEPPSAPPGQIEAGGYLLAPQTVEELGRIELDEFPLLAERPRRVLMLERDGLAVDDELRRRLSSTSSVEVAPGTGYADMTSHPQRSVPPEGVIERVRRWLDEGSAPSLPELAEPALRSTSASPSTRLRTPDGAWVRETPLTLAPDAMDGNLSAVLVEPDRPVDHGLCVILLNGGAVRRIGPNRMWVEAARRWAAGGVPTLRLDVEAIGDADGDETPYRDDGALYEPHFVPQVLSVIDYLAERGLGSRFILGGLCSGAYWSFHAALEEPRVCAVMLVNPRALIWDEGLGPARDLRALLTERFSLSKLRRVVTRDRLGSFLRWMVATPYRWGRRLLTGENKAAAQQRELADAFERYIDSGRRALLLFSEHEPVYDELARAGLIGIFGPLKEIVVDRVPVRDHTLRPTSGQGVAHAALDRLVMRDEERILASEATATSGNSSSAPHSMQTAS